MAKSKPLSKDAASALRSFEETLGFHRNLTMAARSRYRAYRGLLEKNSDPDSWRSKLHPPYVNHIIETTLAALVDDALAFRVKPRPKFYNSSEERQQAADGAKAHEILMRYQLQQDRFSEKLRTFVLQSCIVGVTVAKTHWRSEARRRKHLEVVDVGAEAGFPGLLFDLQEAERVDRVYDGPCTEVVNIEDIFWHEAATELQRSPIIGHRVWMTFEELKQAESRGEYRNVDALKESRDLSDEQAVYDLDERKRTKDMIEVLELWWTTESGIKTCTLGNRNVELRSVRDNPFWHGEYPFVAASTQPDLFKVTGTSQVSKVASLQEAAWDFLNQMHDNVRLINNFIVGVNTDMVTDPDALEVGPGERWEVQGDLNQAVQVFQPSPLTAQVALPHISMLQNDMQNLAQSHPFTSTSEAGRQGSDTATEAALVTNLAQAAAKQMKTQLMYAYQRIGQQRMELNQQFIRRPVMVEVVGLDEGSEFREIAPMLLQGDYAFDLEPMNESLMRSERRAEANTMMQVALQVLPAAMPLAQAAAQAGQPGEYPNIMAIFREWASQYTEDVDRFVTARPAPQAPMPGQQQPAQAGQPGPGGTTSQYATDPAYSPSNEMSLSPDVQMQRMLAMRGGVANT